ncbi:hypothetical protein BP5796_10182 [Coleophoma crateriformis]|uniref:Uncharacterized protein n=1 Tax=Coleophoma crateriformis TaxID=565419 RepID=A0A3D8QV00_9HELO|nr:hypothetical protein BP5796_10182 [Coleophoma crateriformis]
MAIQDTATISAGSFKRDKIIQVRTGKVKPCFGLSDPSAIYKSPLTKPVRVTVLGCEGDEQAYEHHGGPDKALMHYASQHYKQWQIEYPFNAHLFTTGGFGENIVSQVAEESNICIGDILSLGKEILIQVSEPRQPCYKLNHRFEMKNMSLLSQNAGRTGWYYRVLREGNLQPGDEMFLVDRKYPQWTIRNMQRYLYEEPYRKDEKAMAELAELPELGLETRTIFANRLNKVFLNENMRLQGGGTDALKWTQYRLVRRQEQTPKITAFEFEALTWVDNPTKVEPGTHIRVKLGKDGRLVRAYSVVKGDSNCFTLGIALEESGRGGSQYIHEQVSVGDLLTFGEMKSDFALNKAADEHIFIAGGIGITAFVASATKLLNQSAKYHLFYAVKKACDIAFKDELAPLGKNITVLDGSQGQRLDLLKVIGKASSQTHVYVCGPERLLTAVQSTARELGFPASNVHFEAFVVATSGDPFMVGLVKSQKTLDVASEQTLLDVLRDAGLDIPSTCEVGNCGTCRVGVRKGRVEHRGTGLIDDEKCGSMLSCVSRGIGHIELEL